MLYFVNLENKNGKRKGWDATRYFAQCCELLPQFVGVLEETEKSILSKDTPQKMG